MDVECFIIRSEPNLEQGATFGCTYGSRSWPRGIKDFWTRTAHLFGNIRPDIMSSNTLILYCFALPPIRTCLMGYLPAMDVASLVVSLNAELTKTEESLYLSPAKDVLDVGCLRQCMLHKQAFCTFVGRDLRKPTAISNSKSFGMKRAPVEIRLLLLIGCCTNDSSSLLLQCREHVLEALRQDSRCEFKYLGPPNDQQANHIVLMPSIRTTIYLFNPSKSPSDSSNSILYLETGILDSIWGTTSSSHVVDHVIMKSTTSVFQGIFTVNSCLWPTRHPYFLLHLKDDFEGATAPINIFLVTYPGSRSLEVFWTGVKASAVGSMVDRVVKGPLSSHLQCRSIAE